jgi:adenylate kinase
MNIKNIFIVLGPPGSGKGTQSKLLADKLNYAHLSTGEILREKAKEDSDLGREIKNTIDNGIIVTDEIIRKVFVEKLLSVEKNGVILDGYPRTIGQVKILEEIMQENNITNLKVVFLTVDREKLLQRLTGRKTCSKCQEMYKVGMPEYDSGVCGKCGGQLVVRADDDPQVQGKRFDEYHLKTAPVKDYYEQVGNLIIINGDQPIEDVQREIIKKLEI